MTTQFNFDPATSSAVIDRMLGAPSAGAVKMQGTDLAQGLFGALVNAEFLAAQAGVVPFVPLLDGQGNAMQGIAAVGGARESLDKAPNDVRTIYLATYGAARLAHAAAKPPLTDTPELSELGIAPLILVLGAVAVAATIGTAWYFVSKTKVEAEVAGQNLRAAAAASNIAALAKAQLAQTGKIDPAVWSSLSALAATEDKQPAGSSLLVPALVGGGVVAAGAGYYAWNRWAR